MNSFDSQVDSVNSHCPEATVINIMAVANICFSLLLYSCFVVWEKASHGIITACSCLLYDSFQYSNEVAASGLKAKKSDDAQVFKACATKKQTLLLNYMRWSNFDFRDSLLLLLSHQDFIIHSVTKEREF